MIFTHSSGSVKTFHVLVGPIGMNECQICGLLFIRGNTCPGCGSQVYENVSTSDDEESNPTSLSVPPGLDEFRESFQGIAPASDIAEEVEEEQLSNLPFGVGGDSAQMQSQLPFGVGSRVLETGSKEDDSEEDIVQDKATSIVDTAIDAVQEVVEEVVDTAVEEVAARAVGVKAAGVVKDIVHDAVHETGEAIQEVITESLVQNHTESKVVPASEPTTVGLEEIPIVRARAISTEKPESFSKEPLSESDQVSGEDVVIHDYGDEFHEDVVMVDLDEIVEHESAGQVFDPTVGEEMAELTLFPAKALPVNDGGNVEVRDLVSEGFIALSGKNWDRAIEIFHSLATKAVGGSAVLNNYGLGLLQRAIEKQDSGKDTGAVESHFDASIYALRQAAKIDGQRSEILFNLGTAFSKSGRYDKAEVVFDTLLNRDGPSSAVMNGKAFALKGMGKFSMATDTLRKALSLYPGDEILLKNLSKLTPA